MLTDIRVLQRIFIHKLHHSNSGATVVCFDILVLSSNNVVMIGVLRSRRHFQRLRQFYEVSKYKRPWILDGGLHELLFRIASSRSRGICFKLVPE